MTKPAPEQDPLTGKTLRAYRIQEPIGVSRWGKVYRASQSSMNRTVAVRILSSEIAALPGRTGQFLEDSRAAARMIHPHLVAVYEAGQAEGTYFCAMEYMDGPPLSEFLRKGNAVDEHHLLQMIIGVARALDFLWQRKVPHQPPLDRNVLTTIDGSVKLVNIEPDEVQASHSPQDDILNIALMVAAIANGIAPVSRTISGFVECMLGIEGHEPFASLGEVADAAEALDHELFPPVRSGAPTTGKTKLRRLQSLTVVGIGLFALLMAALAIWFWWRMRSQ